MTDKEAELFKEEIRKRIKVSEILFIRITSFFELEELYNLCYSKLGVSSVKLYNSFYGKSIVISVDIRSGVITMFNFHTLWTVTRAEKEVITFSSIYNKVKNMKGVD